MYKTVYDLSGEERLELKYAYFDQLQSTEDADSFHAPEEIPDEVVFNHYDEVMFTEGDFSCGAGDIF